MFGKIKGKVVGFVKEWNVGILKTENGLAFLSIGHTDDKWLPDIKLEDEIVCSGAIYVLNGQNVTCTDKEITINGTVYRKAE